MTALLCILAVVGFPLGVAVLMVRIFGERVYQGVDEE